MPYVDLPSRNLRQYYVINPDYSADTSMSIKTPPPPSRDSIDPDKPVLVLTHAGTSSSNSFIHQFRDPRLSNALNLVCFDSRYYGRTEGPRLDHYQDLEERADELLDAIDAVVGDRPFSYLGESFVKAVILISPSWTTDPPEMIDILEREWAPLASANKFGKGDGTGRIPDEAMAIARDYFFSGSNLEPERQEGFLRQYQETHGPGEDMFKLEQLTHWFKRSEPSKELFAGVRCPVLLLGGTLDTQVSGSDALQQWHNLLVSAPEADKRIERIVDGPHLLATTNPNIVNRFVLCFLKRYNLV
ncbi:alpha/beta fold family hydrolase [Rhodotorula toruloides]|uniref:Alpha/beta fold family hydrolase n=1 Tax=Rhodotorula toruloides TaxID=5286 RepID=A0A511KD23_RHOTO|nr:alpha/beta fold family hydrolase [Rhodotorula toruloides]